MNTHPSSKTKIRRSRSEWQAIIAEYKQSGLDAKSFCAEKRLAYSSFAKWRRDLKRVTGVGPARFRLTN